MKIKKQRALKILRKARKILSQEGVWITGALHVNDFGKDQYCILGALNKAARRNNRARAHWSYRIADDLGLTEYLSKKGSFYRSAWQWNDHQTSVTPVLNLLEEYEKVVEAHEYDD